MCKSTNYHQPPILHLCINIHKGKSKYKDFGCYYTVVLVLCF